MSPRTDVLVTKTSIVARPTLTSALPERRGRGLEVLALRCPTSRIMCPLTDTQPLTPDGRARRSPHRCGRVTGRVQPAPAVNKSDLQQGVRSPASADHTGSSRRPMLDDGCQRRPVRITERRTLKYLVH